MIQNIGLAMLIIGVLIPLAAAGVLGLATVVFIHEAAEVLVILNAIRAARTRALPGLTTTTVRTDRLHVTVPRAPHTRGSLLRTGHHHRHRRAHSPGHARSGRPSRDQSARQRPGLHRGVQDRCRSLLPALDRLRRWPRPPRRPRLL
jgi:hypothetical protein